MANDYYTSTNLIRNTQAKAEDINTRTQAIESGFSKLPAPYHGVTYAVDSGAADAYVVTLSPVPNAYSAGLSFRMKATHTNTGASTVDVNALGAKSIVNHSGTALSGGDIVADGVYELIYDGTNFQLNDVIGTTAALLDEDDMASDSATSAASQQSVRAFVEGKILDEDDMASGSAVHAPSQQSTKAYADNEKATLLGFQTIFVPAGAMTSRSTNGASSGSVETTTNKVMLESMDFDNATDEFAQFSVQMPKSWDAGTVTAQFIWSHPATTTDFGVRFFIQGAAFADDDAADTAFGTAVGHTADTGGTTDDIYLTPVTGAITISNTPAKSDYVIFQIYREVDARLHGVSLFYTTDAHTDA